MRVMTWNLWWRFGPWEARQSAIASVLAEQMPDILFLQEVWSEGGDSSARRLAEPMGYHHALTDDPFAERRRGEPGFHNAIVSRWPLTDVVSHALPRADGAPGHRRALSGVVSDPAGLRWPLISVHLDHRFDESVVRQRQCEALLSIVVGIRNDPETGPPVVVGGDFNAPPDADEIRSLTGRRAAPVAGLVLSDCWEHSGDGPGSTWRSDNPYQSTTAWPDRRLDYLFVSWPRPRPLGNPVRTWLAGLAPVDGVVPSDHAAVVADLVAEPVSS
jgi:endonuclease/exonuclease/phosphatase family metal-dependent hydrolase